MVFSVVGGIGLDNAPAVGGLSGPRPAAYRRPAFLIWAFASRMTWRSKGERFISAASLQRRAARVSMRFSWRAVRFVVFVMFIR
jgi:hypothetical protein